ncbi:MAG: glycosyltransferase family 39 protein [Opitutae bacterium]|nr:glycosyltransferase family 39 protein [Opitutae bacterium]
MNRQHLSWPLGALLTALLAVPACWLLFTQFMVYDDEGYVLWSLKNYVELGGLYTRVYSQYGPAFFAAYDAAHRLTGLAFTNENARWITLALWCGTAFLAGSMAAMLTRSTIARLAATALAFAALFAMSSEPIHPGGPLAFLSAVAAWCGCDALLRQRPRRLAIACGAIGAAMLLTKVNVGVFLFIASGSWLVLHGPWTEKTRRQLGSVVLLGCVISPLLLMREKLSDSHYAGFALMFASGSAAVALLLRRDTRSDTSVRDWGVFVASAVAVALTVGAAVLARGTALADLVHGVAIAPFKQTGAYSFAPRAALPAACVGLVGLAVAAWLASQPVLPRRTVLAIAWVRLIMVVAIAGVGIDVMHQSVSRYLFYCGTALAWLFAWPLQGEKTPTARARLWLGWLFVWQTLHAFPVAGSQVAWGSLLGAPLLVIGAHEAISILFPNAPVRARAVALVVCGVTLVPCVVLARTGWFYKKVSAPLDLPGAERLALPPNIAQALQAMSRNVVLHGDLLFSHPGMFSFNLWTGHPTPTAANVTLWSTLLSEEQQKEIQMRLAADPRAVVIGQEYVLNHLIAQGFAPQGELNRFLVRNFTPAFRIDTYVFWVRRGRTIAPVGTAHRDAESSGCGWQIELITDRAGRAATWELWTNGEPRLVGRGEIDGARASVELLNDDGTAAAPSRPFADATLPGRLCRMSFSIPPLKLPSVDDLELRVLDAEGRTLERVPFRR